MKIRVAMLEFVALAPAFAIARPTAASEVAR
jgi:hypothetical protein